MFNFHNTILKSEPSKWEKIAKKTENNKVKITYTDIYLKDALGCLMLLNFIKSISQELHLEISSLQFNLSKFNNFQRYGNSDEIDKDWSDSGLRKTFLNHSTEIILNIIPKIQEDSFLPHWRELVFTSDKFELIIRPNGGIKNGWKIDSSDNYITQENIDYFKDIRLFNTNQRDGILYNIVFEKKSST